MNCRSPKYYAINHCKIYSNSRINSLKLINIPSASLHGHMLNIDTRRPLTWQLRVPFEDLWFSSENHNLPLKRQSTPKRQENWAEHIWKSILSSSDPSCSLPSWNYYPQLPFQTILFVAFSHHLVSKSHTPAHLHFLFLHGQTTERSLGRICKEEIIPNQLKG